MEYNDLKTYTHGPKSGEEPKQLVILLHGLGSDGKDLIGLAPLLADSLPDAVFVSPDAPFPCDMAPMGYQWFSLQEWTPETLRGGVERVQPILDSFIAGQIEKYGVLADKTALVGFSQGTMVSLYTAPRFPEKLAGVLAYSGALIGAEGLGDEGIHKIPVRLIHGDHDNVVPVTAYHQAKAQLKERGFDVSGGVTPGLAHSIDQQGIGSGIAFLRRVFGLEPIEKK